MPFVLIIVGEMLLVSAIAGTQDDFFGLVKDDFSGQGSFIYWLAAIALIGAIGYIPKAKPFSNAMLILVLLVLVLHQNPSQLFSQFTQALSASTQPSASATIAPNGQSATGNIPPEMVAPANGSQTSAPQIVSSATDFIGQAVSLAGKVA